MRFLLFSLFACLFGAGIAFGEQDLETKVTSLERRVTRLEANSPRKEVENQCFKRHVCEVYRGAACGFAYRLHYTVRKDLIFIFSNGSTSKVPAEENFQTERLTCLNEADTNAECEERVPLLKMISGGACGG